MLKVGSAVQYIDEHGAPHTALITAIHNGKNTIDTDNGDDLKSCINVVYVASDSSKRDPYGQQVERASSVQGQSEFTAHGRYWVRIV